MIINDDSYCFSNKAAAMICVDLALETHAGNAALS